MSSLVIGQKVIRARRGGGSQTGSVVMQYNYQLLRRTERNVVVIKWDDGMHSEYWDGVYDFDLLNMDSEWAAEFEFT